MNFRESTLKTLAINIVMAGQPDRAVKLLTAFLRKNELRVFVWNCDGQFRVLARNIAEARKLARAAKPEWPATSFDDEPQVWEGPVVLA